MRADFRNEIEKVISLSCLALFLNPEAKAKIDAFGRGQNEPEPFFPLQGADVSFFPGVENFGSERDYDGGDYDDGK
jgi:hypothetical protein